MDLMYALTIQQRVEIVLNSGTASIDAVCDEFNAKNRLTPITPDFVKGLLEQFKTKYHICNATEIDEQIKKAEAKEAKKKARKLKKKALKAKNAVN